MKTYQCIIFYGILAAAAVVLILACEKLIWKIVFPAFIAGFAYIVWELDHAIPMPPEYNDEGVFPTNFEK